MDGSPDPDATSAETRRPDELELSAQERVGLTTREPAALERFFELYFDRVYGYVRRLLRQEHLAEDVTQDIFMHIHRALPRYDPERDLRPWVFTIATNKVRDHWRSRRHQDSRSEISADDAEGGSFEVHPAVARERRPDECLLAGELSDQVAAAIEELPESMRETLVLRYYEGLSFAEIGALMDRNEVAIRKRYSRALEELRKRLAHLVESAGDSFD